MRASKNFRNEKHGKEILLVSVLAILLFGLFTQGTITGAAVTDGYQVLFEAENMDYDWSWIQVNDSRFSDGNAIFAISENSTLEFNFTGTNLYLLSESRNDYGRFVGCTLYRQAFVSMPNVTYFSHWRLYKSPQPPHPKAEGGE